MSDKIIDTSKINDEKLGELIKTLMDKHEDNMEAVAHELNTTVIRPAGERSAAYILRVHHKALYEALPVGDVDAFDMLEVVNNHLNSVAQAIQVLETPEAQQVAPEESN